LRADHTGLARCAGPVPLPAPLPRVRGFPAPRRARRRAEARFRAARGPPIRGNCSPMVWAKAFCSVLSSKGAYFLRI
jgi:hypothetical protein